MAVRIYSASGHINTLKHRQMKLYTYRSYPAMLILFCSILAKAEQHPGSETAINAIQMQTEYTDHLMASRYATYNEWANKAMAAWLSEASNAEMDMDIESSFKSLRSTALHIWSAEYLWLQVLKDEPYDDNPTKSFDGSTAELIAGWLATSAAFKDYVDKLKPADLESTRGDDPDKALRVDDIIQHCMNHSTYHRGQLITMGRQAGLADPPRTDFIYFVRQR